MRRGDVVYAWDAAGRLEEKREGAQRWRYAWDAAGRLSRAVLPAGRRVDYLYDPFGRLLEARIGGAERTRFVWDGDTIAHAIITRAAEQGDPVVDVDRARGLEPDGALDRFPLQSRADW